MTKTLPDPQPTDAPFLFAILVAARKSGDSMLESLARDWLSEIGIHVVFGDELSTPPRSDVPQSGEGEHIDE
jgi:hypothetical protein